MVVLPIPCGSALLLGLLAAAWTAQTVAPPPGREGQHCDGACSDFDTSSLLQKTHLETQQHLAVRAAGAGSADGQALCSASTYRVSNIVFDCSGAEGSQSFQIPGKRKETAQEIPKGAVDLTVGITANVDVDVFLYDAAAKQFVVHYSSTKAAINDRARAGTYKGIPITFTGDDRTSPVTETVILDGTLPFACTLQLQNYAEEDAEATMTYSYTGVEPCPDPPPGCSVYTAQVRELAQAAIEDWSYVQQVTYASAEAAWQARSPQIELVGKDEGILWASFRSVFGDDHVIDQVTLWMAVFKYLDADSDGVIFQSEFAAGYHAYMYNATSALQTSLILSKRMQRKYSTVKEAWASVRTYVTSFSGVVWQDWDKVCAYFISSHGVSNHTASFMDLGADRKGYISKLSSGNDIDCKGSFMYLDLDRDGYISSAEFAACYNLFHEPVPESPDGMTLCPESTYRSAHIVFNRYGGSGTQSFQMPAKKMIVQDIPKGTTDMHVAITANVDVDVFLYDSGAEAYIVHHSGKKALINDRDRTGRYHGMPITFSGDAHTSPVTETLTLNGTMPTAASLQVQNYAAKVAKANMTYSYSRVEPCPDPPPGCSAYTAHARELAGAAIQEWSYEQQVTYASAEAAWQARSELIEVVDKDEVLMWSSFPQVFGDDTQVGNVTLWMAVFKYLDTDSDGAILQTEFAAGYYAYMYNATSAHESSLVLSKSMQSKYSTVEEAWESVQVYSNNNSCIPWQNWGKVCDHFSGGIVDSKGTFMYLKVDRGWWLRSFARLGMATKSLKTAQNPCISKAAFETGYALYKTTTTTMPMATMTAEEESDNATTLMTTPEPIVDKDLFATTEAPPAVPKAEPPTPAPVFTTEPPVVVKVPVPVPVPELVPMMVPFPVPQPVPVPRPMPVPVLVPQPAPAPAPAQVAPCVTCVTPVAATLPVAPVQAPSVMQPAAVVPLVPVVTAR